MGIVTVQADFSQQWPAQPGTFLEQKLQNTTGTFLYRRLAAVATDTFRLSGKKFRVGETLHLDPKTKREVTICNLFANHDLAVADIIRVLDETYGNVIRSLIKHGILIDRRQQQRESPWTFDRRAASN
jgi:hypothetical protein